MSERKIGLFASVHNPDFLKSTGWSEKDIINLFDRFNPHIICGEVRKYDYLNNSDYQGPGEYKRYIFNYCNSNNIKFVPCDWYTDETINATRIGEMSNANSKLLSEFNDITEELIIIGKNACIPFNSDTFNDLVRKKQSVQKCANPDLHKVIWTDRNDNIVHNILNVISENPKKNILIIFGAEHIYYIKDELEKRFGEQVVFPLIKSEL